MVLMEFSITPLGRGDSVGAYVARCVDLVDASGLDYRLHAMGTIVEGELDELLKLLAQCFAALQDDCDRVSCAAKFDYRRGATGRLQSKVQSVQSRIDRPLKTGD